MDKSERIAAEIERRVAMVSTVNGYSFDASVIRPGRSGYTGADGLVLIEPELPKRIEDIEGSPPRFRYETIWNVTAYLASRNNPDLPVDSLANIAIAELWRALVTQSDTFDWATLGGEAESAAFAGSVISADGRFATATLSIAVVYIDG